MTTFKRRLVGGVAALGAAVLIIGAPLAAQAQMKAGVGQSQKISVSATVKSVDVATRHAVLIGPGGETFRVKVSKSVQNLDRVKAGDKITATYYREVEFVLSAPNSKLPPNTDTTLAARAAKGEVPAGFVANHVVVTGAVLAVNVPDNTLKIVNPKGGMVHTIQVTDPLRQKQLAKVKVGDTITAYVTEALLVSVS